MKVIKVMVEVGFDVTAVSHDGRFPFHTFIQRGLKRITFNNMEEMSHALEVTRLLLRGISVTHQLPQVSLSLSLSLTLSRSFFIHLYSSLFPHKFTESFINRSRADVGVTH